MMKPGKERYSEKSGIKAKTNGGYCQGNEHRSFLNFLENSVVHEQNLDTWEFGKGALSELRFCGVAVLQLERG
jgi:hypothetical protein